MLFTFSADFVLNIFTAWRRAIFSFEKTMFTKGKKDEQNLPHTVYFSVNGTVLVPFQCNNCQSSQSNPSPVQVAAYEIHAGSEPCVRQYSCWSGNFSELPVLQSGNIFGQIHYFHVCGPPILTVDHQHFIVVGPAVRGKFLANFVHC